MLSNDSPVLWLGFLVFVAAMIAVDLGVFRRKTHEVSFREALIWTGVWISLALGFSAVLALLPGFDAGESQLFLTGYTLELALSVDNMFVFILIFRAYSVPKAYQHRVLVWGILGAAFLRGVFIVAGSAIIARFHWVLYLFGAFLLYTGARMFFESDENEDVDIESSASVKLVRRLIGPRMTDRYHHDHFLVHEGGQWSATPLLLVLCMIELSDLVFALDSIPAIFAVTTNPFLVFSSNMFAILGLRSIYFVLDQLLPMFRFLKYGVALVLAFIGLKIIVTDALHDFLGWPPPPEWLSLLVIGVVLGGSVVLSWVIPEKKESESASPPRD